MKRIHMSAASSRALRAAAASALILVLCVTAALAYEREETLRRTIPLQEASRIVVSNSRGDITVIGEKGRKDVLCEYTKRIRGRDQDEANRLFNLMDIEVAKDGRNLKISARYPNRTDKDWNILGAIMRYYTGLSIDLNIVVPSGFDAEIVSSSGDVQLASILGAAEITSASGDVEVTGIGKDLKVDVSSGDATVSDVGGKLFLRSASGDIEVHDIKGAAQVQTASGDIVLGRIGGDLTLGSVSGDVSVEGVREVVFSGTSGSARFTGVRGGVIAALASGDIEVGASPEIPAKYEIRTSSGQIELRFEQAAAGGFALKAQTTSGEISLSLPIKVSKVSRHNITGVVREGKSIVVLETASGDITVTEPGE
jgi:DUF4097 and DUF4098 domain-containing protein YvlB